MGKQVRTVILGAGAGASYFVLGLQRLKNGEAQPVGIPYEPYMKLYRPEDVEVVGVFDVDVAKVGRSLRAVAAKEVGVPDVPRGLDDIEILRGLHCGSTKGLPIEAKGLDDLAGSASDAVKEFVDELARLSPDVVVNAITTEPMRFVEDSAEFRSLALSCAAGATITYAYAVAEYSRLTGRPAAFVNLTPPPAANSPGVVAYYESVGSLVLGDDAATGATPLTADLLEHMAERGRRVLSVVQFNIGGNSDFLSLTEPERNRSKEVTKSSMLMDILGYEPPHYIKPTGYLEPLGHRKFVSMHIEYEGFGGFRDEVFVVARINDKANLAGLMASIIPISKALVDKGVKGTYAPANRFFMKMPGPRGSKNVSKIVAYYELLEELRRLGIV